MNLQELQITPAEFRANPRLQRPLAELLIDNGNKFLEPYRNALILALATQKNVALEPKVTVQDSPNAVTHAYWASRGVVQVIRGLNELATPLDQPNDPNALFDPILGVHYSKQDLPQELQEEPVLVVPTPDHRYPTPPTV